MELLTRILVATISVGFGDGWHNRAGARCCLRFIRSLLVRIMLWYTLSFCSPNVSQCFQHENMRADFNVGQIVLRVDVVLDDPSRDQRLHLGQWSLLLPSDVSHWPVWNCGDVMIQLFCGVGVVDSCFCIMYFVWISICRFSAIYHYDWNLFKARFVGPDGVPLLYVKNWWDFIIPANFFLVGDS